MCNIDEIDNEVLLLFYCPMLGTGMYFSVKFGLFPKNLSCVLWWSVFARPETESRLFCLLTE